MTERERLDTVTYVEPVTPEMERAGQERLIELRGEPDLRYVATAVYFAMEYQRLGSLGQLRRLGDHPLQEADRQLSHS